LIITRAIGNGKPDAVLSCFPKGLLCFIFLLCSAMIARTARILLLEPYYGGSHQAFLQGLQRHLPFDFTLISLPARKWKMRMQLAAPWMAAQVIEQVRSGAGFDALLCSTFLDVALLRSLLSQAGLNLPVAVYFHENQFVYPARPGDSSRFQFTALNFTTALAADRLGFNSRYNLATFMQGVRAYLQKATDMDLSPCFETLAEKSTILYPGLDYSRMAAGHRPPGQEAPVIVWNHRWEHDKDPDTFFRVLGELSAEGLDFRLIVLGQSFLRRPKVFALAGENLRRHIIHFGYAGSEQDYFRLLRRGDIVVSTARHEFFGLAVLEAVRCGCRPLVPDGLAYRELYHERYRYPAGGLKPALRSLLSHPLVMDRNESLVLTEPYSWPRLAPAYRDWLSFS